LLSKPESTHAVIALPPSGLMGGYWRVVRRSGGKTVALADRPENILARIRFFDLDSKPIERRLTDREKSLYLKEIRKDITYFKKSYERADLKIDIRGLDVDEAAGKIWDTLVAINEEALQPGKSGKGRDGG
jgi:shikimate kinase